MCESSLLINLYSEGVELVVPLGPICSIFSPVKISGLAGIFCVFGMVFSSGVRYPRPLSSKAHTKVKTSDPVRSRKLSTFGVCQYCGGGPRGNPDWP